MNNLKLGNPKMMDVAIPANLRQGLVQAQITAKGWAVSGADAQGLLGQHDIVLIDLRERLEREKHGAIPGAPHLSCHDLQDSIAPGGTLYLLDTALGRTLLFSCAFGERSAMAVQAAQDAGFSSARHIEGGIDAWKKASGTLA